MSWLQSTSEGLQLQVRVTPRASRNQVAGVSGDRLKLKLTAAPVDGKANAALIRYLADLFGVAKSSISITRGDTGREKTVFIRPAPELPPVLTELVNSGL